MANENVTLRADLTRHVAVVRALRAAVPFILVGGSAVVWVGWFAHIEALVGVLPHLASMKVNTALGFMLVGIGLWCVGRPDMTRSTAIGRTAAAGLLIVLGALTVSQDIFGFNAHIDQLIADQTWASGHAAAPGRMSPSTAVCFVLCGAALAAFDRRRASRMRLAQAIMMLEGAVALLAICGYAYGVSDLYRMWAFSSMAIHTAVGFLLAAAWVLTVEVRTGLLAALTESTPRGIMLRLLLPISIFGPMVLGAVVLHGAKVNWYPDTIAVALMAVATISLMLAMLAVVARRLNEAEAERVRAADRLRELNATLEQRVADRTEDLQRRNEQLDEFAYIASHDLKSPLRAIGGLASYIRRDAAEVLPPTARDHLDRLQDRTTRAVRLLDDLMRFATVDRVEARAESVDVASLVEEVVATVVPPHGPTVTAEALPTLVTWYTPLATVLRNLIDNAVHHGRPSDGRIEITAKSQGGFIEFVVADNGPGIAPEHHQRIFQMFQKLSRDGDSAGSGAGLALARKIVLAFGGRIWVESEPGHGARFHFTWPVDAGRITNR